MAASGKGGLFQEELDELDLGDFFGIGR